MTWMEKKQIRQMRWVLFYIFVTLFVIVAALTIMAVFFKDILPLGIGNHEKLLVKIFIVKTGLIVIALFKSLFSLKRQPAAVEDKPTVPKVNGKYKYEEIWGDNKKVYIGECRIKQDGQELTIQGERTKECNGRKNKKVSIHWFSNWAEFCSDNKIRMDYAITENGGGRGYAILEIGKDTSRAMLGEVHVFKGDYNFGTLKFKKVNKAKVLRNRRSKKASRSIRKSS